MATREEVRALLLNLDLCSFLDSVDIPYELAAKNVGQGWIGIETCPFCFHKSTKILTSKGLITIDKIKIGDLVLSRDGLFNKVVQTHSRKIKEDLIKFYAAGMTNPIKCTRNHKLFCSERLHGKHIGLVEKKKGSRAHYTWLFGEVEAKELVSNAMKYNSTRDSLWIELADIKSLTDELIDDAYFYGLYCAEGHIHGKNSKYPRSFAFSLNANEEDLIKKLEYKFGKVTKRKHPTGNCIQVFINNSTLTKRYMKLGMGAENKLAPLKILQTNHLPSIHAFVEGVFDGDGHITKNNLHSLTTVSPTLALHISILLRKLGFPASLNFTEAHIGNDNIYRRPTYHSNFTPTDRYSPNIRNINGKWYGKLLYAKTFETSTNTVYNLTIENNHSYCANGAIVKNCGDDRTHLGLNLVNKTMNCWVCGTRGTLVKFLMKTRDINVDKALDLIKVHSNGETEIEDIEQRVKTILKPTLQFPPLTKPVANFDLPGEFITANLVRTKPRLQAFMTERHLTLDICARHNFLYDWEKSLRLIMPIFNEEGNLYAYTARDVTGRALLRYIVKPDGINLGKVLYNLNNYNKHKYIIGVEGILDAVRIEYLVEKYVDTKYLVVAFNTSNPSSTHLNLLSKLKVKKFFAMFDRDSWFKYKSLLDLPYDVEHVILPLGKDPNQLRKDEFLDLSFWRSE